MEVEKGKGKGKEKKKQARKKKEHNFPLFGFIGTRKENDKT